MDTENHAQYEIVSYHVCYQSLAPMEKWVFQYTWLSTAPFPTQLADPYLCLWSVSTVTYYQGWIQIFSKDNIPMSYGTTKLTLKIPGSIYQCTADLPNLLGKCRHHIKYAGVSWNIYTMLQEGVLTESFLYNLVPGVSSAHMYLFQYISQ